MANNMIEVIGFSYDEWLKEGKFTESHLREWRDFVDWDTVFTYLSKHNIKLSDDFLLELYKQHRINIYRMSMYPNILNKHNMKFFKRDVDRYDDKYQVEYSYKYFPPIWENIFRSITGKKWRKKMFDRFMRFKTYKYVRKSELNYVPKELAGIWDC